MYYEHFGNFDKTLTFSSDGGDADFMLNWPSVFTSVPRIVPRPEHGGKANGYAIGNVNGNGNRDNCSTKKAI
jgi:hypothetical protein